MWPRTRTLLYRSIECPRVISGFCRDADEICALLGCYVASSGNSIPTFRDNQSVPPSRVKKSKKIHFLNIEDETDRLSRNIGMEFTALPCVISQKSADLMSPTARVMKSVLLGKSGDGNNPELRSNNV
jgi:hypothetical protein